MILSGGVPVAHGGHVAGAIGVSGGTAEQDPVIADITLEATRREFKEVDNPALEIAVASRWDGPQVCCITARRSLWSINLLSWYPRPSPRLTGCAFESSNRLPRPAFQFC
ncbi:heme-binding protein [Labrys neptuniae]|uniref:heme-binding protein n=1 Tax=Labrys neptuniae TaxID=376174 RepID=UPI0035DB5DA6